MGHQPLPMLRGAHLASAEFSAPDAPLATGKDNWIPPTGRDIDALFRFFPAHHWCCATVARIGVVPGRDFDASTQAMRPAEWGAIRGSMDAVMDRDPRAWVLHQLHCFGHDAQGRHLGTTEDSRRDFIRRATLVAVEMRDRPRFIPSLGNEPHGKTPAEWDALVVLYNDALRTMRQWAGSEMRVCVPLMGEWSSFQWPDEETWARTMRLHDPAGHPLLIDGHMYPAGSLGGGYWNGPGIEAWQGDGFLQFWTDRARREGAELLLGEWNAPPTADGEAWTRGMSRHLQVNRDVWVGGIWNNLAERAGADPVGARANPDAPEFTQAGWWLA